MQSFSGEFEMHITVSEAALDDNRLELLNQVCRKHDWKMLYIVLAEGLHKSQPMVTYRSSGTLAKQLDEAEGVSLILAQSGFETVRTKIEASPQNSDIPMTEGEMSLHQGRYFEQHIKVKVISTEHLRRLTALAKDYEAHVSHNAFRKDHNGTDVHFVTYRSQRGMCSAEEDGDRLRRALAEEGFDCFDHVLELVAFDSFRALDKGWAE